jgi:ATP-dependent DNA helicase RecQ
VETARGEKVPPYVIASDRTLREIAAIRPTNDHDLAAAHGIGSAKVAKYGEAIVGLVQSNSA